MRRDQHCLFRPVAVKEVKQGGRLPKAALSYLGRPTGNHTSDSGLAEVKTRPSLSTHSDRDIGITIMVIRIRQELHDRATNMELDNRLFAIAELKANDLVCLTALCQIDAHPEVMHNGSGRRQSP